MIDDKDIEPISRLVGYVHGLKMAKKMAEEYGDELTVKWIGVHLDEVMKSVQDAIKNCFEERRRAGL